MTNIPIIYEGRNGWSETQHTEDNKIIIVCCDCGLAHEFKFKVKDNNVSFNIRRRDILTKQVRKHDGINYVPNTKKKEAI